MEGASKGPGPPFPPASGGGEGAGGGAPHVRRLRTLKRRKEEKETSRSTSVKLERVLGLTVSSNASLATAPSTGRTSGVLCDTCHVRSNDGLCKISSYDVQGCH